MRIGNRLRWTLPAGLLATALAGVCAAQTLIPVLPGAAKALSLTGQVSVLRDSYPWALNVGDTVSMQEMIITGPDGFAVFEISEGATFEIFPNSRVSFRNNPGSWRDLLDLWIGRVKVHIQKWGGQPNPNRVYTPTAVISVRGTVFDVIIEDENDTTLVSVDEGEVSVRHRLIGESRARLVRAGEYIRVFKNVPLAGRSMDKGALLERSLRAMVDAFYTILLQNTGGSTIPGAGPPTSIPGGGSPLPGDTETVPPPPPPPGDIGGPVAPPPPPGG